MLRSTLPSNWLRDRTSPGTSTAQPKGISKETETGIKPRRFRPDTGGGTRYYPRRLAVCAKNGELDGLILN